MEKVRMVTPYDPSWIGNRKLLKEINEILRDAKKKEISITFSVHKSIKDYLVTSRFSDDINDVPNWDEKLPNCD